MYRHYEKLAKETREVAKQAATDIVATWDSSELTEHQHATLRQALKESDMSLKDYFTIYKELGKFAKIRGCELAMNKQSLLGSAEDYRTADYKCYAEFENSDANIRISLRYDDKKDIHDLKDPWLITTFTIESPIFEKYKDIAPSR